jgi:hypothetical protein
MFCYVTTYRLGRARASHNNGVFGRRRRETPVPSPPAREQDPPLPFIPSVGFALPMFVTGAPMLHRFSFWVRMGEAQINGRRAPVAV